MTNDFVKGSFANYVAQGEEAKELYLKEDLRPVRGILMESEDGTKRGFIPTISLKGRRIVTGTTYHCFEKDVLETTEGTYYMLYLDLRLYPYPQQQSRQYNDNEAHSNYVPYNLLYACAMNALQLISLQMPDLAEVLQTQHGEDRFRAANDIVRGVLRENLLNGMKEKEYTPEMESDFVENKSSFASEEKIFQTMAGMCSSNFKKGGSSRIRVGIDDQTLQVVGLENHLSKMSDIDYITRNWLNKIKQCFGEDMLDAFHIHFYKTADRHLYCEITIENDKVHPIDYKGRYFVRRASITDEVTKNAWYKFITAV